VTCGVALRYYLLDSAEPLAKLFRMKSAFQKDDALLAEMASVADDDPRLHVWWLGQSGYLFQQAGARLLVDAYLSDSLTRKYADTDKPHVRVTERCIAPEHLTRIPLVLSTHQHTDHFDEATLDPMADANSNLQIVVPAGVLAQAQSRLPCPSVLWTALNDGEVVNAHGWRVTGVAAAHNHIERDEAGRCKFLGFVIQRGGFSIYHSGDTLLHDGLVPALKPFACDLALVPINGNKPERRVAGNLNPHEAANLARDIGARIAVPHHYDMFEFNTADPAEFVAECHRANQDHRVLRVGERLLLP